MCAGLWAPYRRMTPGQYTTAQLIQGKTTAPLSSVSLFLPCGCWPFFDENEVERALGREFSHHPCMDVLHENRDVLCNDVLFYYLARSVGL